MLGVGKERLTTTKVALRVGVSVGSAYQYFPNKSALLQAALKCHLDEVTEAVELACKTHRDESLRNMATALINTFLQAKMKHAKTGAALYAVSSDVDRAKIVQRMSVRFNEAIVQMLATAREQLSTDPPLVASMLQGAMVGVSSRMLESAAPEDHFESLRQELIFVACAYLDARAARKARRPDSAISQLKALPCETVNIAAEGSSARVKSAAHGGANQP